MKSPVDITLIGSAPFEWYMKHKNTEVFITSLYKIDWIIKDKQFEEQQAEEISVTTSQVWLKSLGSSLSYESSKSWIYGLVCQDE